MYKVKFMLEKKNSYFYIDLSISLKDINLIINMHGLKKSSKSIFCWISIMFANTYRYVKEKHVKYVFLEWKL